MIFSFVQEKTHLYLSPEIHILISKMLGSRYFALSNTKGITGNASPLLGASYNNSHGIESF